MDVIQSKLPSEQGILKGKKGYEVVYIAPKILDFLANADALSQGFTVFKYGGTVNGEDAIPFMKLEEVKY